MQIYIYFLVIYFFNAKKINQQMKPFLQHSHMLIQEINLIWLTSKCT